VWLATSAGIWRYHGEDGLPPSFDRVEDPLLGHGSTGVLFEDRDRRLWLNADRRMLCVQEGVLRESAIPDLGNQVRAMLQARDGSLWFGTYGAGAWRMTGRAIARITNGISIHERVWAFHEDASGTIWMGTEHGLKRWRDDRCDSFGMREGLLEELVNHVVGDDTGHLWLSGLRGIYRVSSDDLDSVAAGRRHTVRCTAYGSMDGLLNPETNGEMQPAGCRTADGHLWFPTMDGVAMIDPAAVQEESFAPQAMIEGVAASGAPESETVPPGEVRILPAGSGRAIRVRYTACVFSSASRVRFRHRLLPHHAEWIDGARERVAYYTNLRPGDYRFEVIAANPLGVWSKEPAVLSFRIEPFLWQTPAFVGICVAVGIAIIGGVVAYHSVWQRRVFRLEQGRLLERERARIADDLHDELGANLTGLALKAELARSRAENPVLGEDLASIASTARSLTDATREIIWLASPRHDSLDSLAGHLAGLVERLAASGGLRCRLDVPPRLPPLEVSSPVRHQICLAVKEAVHNALKHSAASAIHFRCQLAQDHVVFEVSDDGRGLPATSAPGRGNGLSSMRERVEHAVGGTLGLRSAPGQGTSVEIRVPCAQLSRRNRE
jgi:signal transduction histidine kinase